MCPVLAPEGWSLMSPHRTCSVSGCTSKYRARGFCSGHYKRWMRYGSIDPSSSLEERFWARVDASGDCWEWTGDTSTQGYGRLTRCGRELGAHRVAYEILVGPIPSGLTIDHLCRVHHCVNPDHMEVVTNRVNVLRGYGIAAQRARRTHCPQGHPYDEANTYRASRNKRVCRTCQREQQRRLHAARRAAVQGEP